MNLVTVCFMELYYVATDVCMFVGPEFTLLSDCLTCLQGSSCIQVAVSGTQRTLFILRDLAVVRVGFHRLIHGMYSKSYNPSHWQQWWTPPPEAPILSGFCCHGRAVAAV